jgi:aspartate kinase
MLPREIPGSDRERDALLCCGEGIAASLLAAELFAKGFRAVSLSGAQLGLTTNGRFGNADILSVDPTNILHYLDRGYVVVAAGFQGTGRDGSLTTLGRGGTDTTAVAIAAGLEAGRVILYKDVEGLFNADPRIVPSARPLPLIPYDEAAHLAFAGAKIIHPRCADLAEREGLTLEVKDLAGRGPGTVITSREAIRKMKPESTDLFAVTCVEDIGQMTVIPAPTRPFPDFPRRLFQELADGGISLDMINLLRDRAMFTLASSDMQRAIEIAEWSGCEVHLLKSCAKISLLGGGIHGVPGIMSRIINALTDAGISIHQSTDTYTVISVLVEGQHAARAAVILHEAFGLARPTGQG